MNQINNSISDTVGEIVNQIIDDLPLEDRVTISKLEEDQIEFINNLIANYIQNKLEEHSLKQDEADLTEPDSIVKEVLNRLRNTHNVRVVK